MHRTLIFLLPESGAPEAVAQQDYVRLLRREVARPEFSGQTLRVADWYVRMGAGALPRIENETYSFLRFNEAGEVDQAVAAGNSKPSGMPTSSLPAATWQPSREELAMIDRIAFPEGWASRA